MIEAMSRAAQYIKFVKDHKLDRREKSKLVMELAVQRVTPIPRKEVGDQRTSQRRRTKKDTTTSRKHHNKKSKVKSIEVIDRKILKLLF